ncbi:histone-lysine N-methyltransferase KMT5C-like [Aphis gossypii]|uniref:histone-lysine N-methyltransferase KMT5C-like n=1 Tax=Aphis gossypii TaxID=80765 RepID=UPI0021596E01|nr:histone-lysine N-methyltransferase KMT5C-like [Aphis gossypii]
MMYIDACAPSSRFTIKRRAMFEEDGDVGAKIMAAKDLKSGTVINELCSRLVTVRESFLKPGRNYFSVVHSNYSKKSQLWLGPAAYANHDCKSNCDIRYLRSSVACLCTNRPIRVGKEITAFYRHHYIDANNVHCLCTTCKEKVEGAYGNTELPLVAKPFLQCAHCPARFLFKSWLVWHLSRYVHIDKFACEECGESFSRKSSLKR